MIIFWVVPILGIEITSKMNGYVMNFLCCEVLKNSHDI